MALVLVLALPGAAAARAPVPFPPLTFGPHELARCLNCHGLPNFLDRDSLTSTLRDLSVDTRAHVLSVHGSLECTQCHPDVRAYPHTFDRGRRAKVSCDADCHATDIEGKPVSHRTQVADFLAGAHRKGLLGTSADSPTCVTCHGAGRPHAIASPRRTLGPRDRMRLCADCHEDRVRMARNRVDAEAVSSYRRSFHYQAVRFGSTKTAVCQDCHAVHRVLSPDSTASTVGAAGVVKTCGQKDCHKGATGVFAMSGANHLDLRARREPVLWLAGRFLWALTWLVSLVALGDIVLDAARRLAAARAGGRRPLAPRAVAAEAPLIARLSVAQRAQHGALAVAFVVLACTGLPLRFPDAEVAARVYGLLGGLTVARTLHRAAAVILIATGLGHLGYAAVLLARSRYDAARAWRLLPGRGDGHEAWELAMFLLGRRALPPASGRFDTRNKLHYLAVAWGLPVMASSGLVLWFPVALGGRLPDLAIALAFLAHSDEALLAIGVVLVWHLYVVHVAPGAHHRFLTWVDGRITRGHQLLRHPREAGQADGATVSAELRRALLEESWAPRPRDRGPSG